MSGSCACSTGQQVEAGDELLVLEAMKMEISVRAEIARRRDQRDLHAGTDPCTQATCCSPSIRRLSSNDATRPCKPVRRPIATGTQSVHDTVDFVLQQIEASASNPIWIARFTRRCTACARRRAGRSRSGILPLYGMPFAIKDNIDLAGLPTTAACPAFAMQPAASAAVVQRLLDAGAIAIGKTNLDQFATGLVGTRSPYGVCRNSFDPRYISGGSSSGSAVAVALGQVSFALGTDTAGSGRVPAAFNNLVGYKPTLGRLSTRGMVPACRSLDAISIFALTANDAAVVAQSAAGFDAGDAWSRSARAADRRGWSRQQSFRFGVPLPAQREFFGNAAYAQLFEASIARCVALGGIAVDIDIEPLLQVARLLYEGPWVAERYLAVQSLLETNPEALHPVTRQIIEPGRNASALDAFRAQYRLQELRRRRAPRLGTCGCAAAAHCGQSLHHRRSDRRSAAAQQQSRPLHQLRQSAGPGGRRGARRLHCAGPALWRHADCAGVAGR